MHTQKESKIERAREQRARESKREKRAKIGEQKEYIVCVL